MQPFYPMQSLRVRVLSAKQGRVGPVTRAASAKRAVGSNWIRVVRAVLCDCSQRGIFSASASPLRPWIARLCSPPTQGIALDARTSSTATRTIDPRARMMIQATRPMDSTTRVIGMATRTERHSYGGDRPGDVTDSPGCADHRLAARADRPLCPGPVRTCASVCPCDANLIRKRAGHRHSFRVDTE